MSCKDNVVSLIGINSFVYSDFNFYVMYLFSKAFEQVQSLEFIMSFKGKLINKLRSARLVSSLNRKESGSEHPG